MNYNYTREQLEDIKKQAGLIPYEKRLGKLTKIGSEYRAYCPWHEQDGRHNPSLSIFKGDNGSWFFKCMSQCEKRKGDVIAFVRLIDNTTFAEAVHKVGSESGLTVAQAGPPQIQKPTAEQYEQVKRYLADSGIPLDFAKNYTKLDAIVHPKLGLALAFPYDADPEVIKYRAITPKSKDLKFSHASGHPSDHLLYNINHAEKEINSEFCPEVFVVESERDCLTMAAHGFIAVSVSSASACIDSKGELKISNEDLAILAKAEYVFIALDQDPAGEKCAEAFERTWRGTDWKLKRLSWPYGGKRSNDPKDIGDLYQQDPSAFRETILQLAGEARQRPPKWRQQFRTVSEMDDSPVIQIIEGFMTEGNVGLGGLSGHGKTFVALSITKAATTGRPFVGRFKVPTIYPVLYLCPEVGERQLRKRIRFFNIPDDEELFLCRTLTQGVTLPLDHPHIREAVRHLGKPIVILDTAIRFSKAEDENSAAANAWMELAVRGLREAGAIVVVLLHHSPKSASKEKEFSPTLENTFRGTGDIGALLDIGYNIRIDKDAPGTQLTITCVKPRDFDPPQPFNLGLKMTEVNPNTGYARSFIEETGDLVLLASVDAELPVRQKEAKIESQFEEAVKANPLESYEEIGNRIDRNKSQTQKLAAKLGWAKRGGKWEQKVGQEREAELVL